MADYSAERRHLLAVDALLAIRRCAAEVRKRSAENCAIFSNSLFQIKNYFVRDTLKVKSLKNGSFDHAPFRGGS